MSKEKLLASAQKNLEKGQIAKAIKDYQKIIETDPKDIRNRQKLAELLGRERMRDEALKEYETVARTYSDTGFYLKAIAVYRQMQKLDPERPEIYLRLAELNEKQGLNGDALAEYRNLSACYEKNRLFSEQLKILQKMLQLEPENLNIRVKVIENSLLVDTVESARKELQALLEDLAAAGDSPRALKLYDHFLPKFPDDLPLQAGHAETLIRKGEKNRGMQMLHDLLRKEPENAGVLGIMANVYRKEGKHQEERLIYERLLVRQPADLEFRGAYLRAGIDAGERAAVRSDLAKWEEDFNNAGRSDLVQDLRMRLGDGGAPTRGAGNAVKTDGASAAAETAAEVDLDGFLGAEDGDPEPETAELAELTEPVEELEEIAELLEEAEELPGKDPATLPADFDDAAEVSLDFLEEAPLDFLEASSLPVQKEAPAPAEIELELELDVELDLDAELEQEDAAVEEGLDGAEDLLEFDPDEATPFATAEVEDATFGIKEAAATASASTGEEAEDFIDFGSDLANELDAPVMPEKETSDSARPKKRIKTDVEVDDPESHYNLGIAYREMGLLDDAIGEFDKAIFAPARAVPCLILKSMCLLEKGERKKAEETLKGGLNRTDVNEEGRISLHFELGEIYESGNQLKEALDCFRYVADRDLFYRGAGERVAALRQRLGIGDDSAGTGAAGGRKNRVSYV